MLQDEKGAVSVRVRFLRPKQEDKVSSKNPKLQKNFELKAVGPKQAQKVAISVYYRMEMAGPPQNAMGTESSELLQEHFHWRSGCIIRGWSGFALVTTYGLVALRASMLRPQYSCSYCA